MVMKASFGLETKLPQFVAVLAQDIEAQWGK
jgi:hypothetical protein